ncbi:beta strand repeat-containing protein [Consotaella salsifontis]|uniref:Curlin associated repeat-containing protein n=1 Tax=Consotaella salsifontis TaxID=1365950 RepID=A0A1T4SGE2_9HYPH|nr:hypothetical protein [Consotaella salsifontis]SKA26871.1 hypothetical protein SAMN05428963_110129 [Consotaella salsifontis]
MTSLNKIAILSASALALATTAALADDNTVFSTQTGENNSALVTQSGVGANAAGSSTHALTQNGKGNRITISQSATDSRNGRGNNVGTGATDKTSAAFKGLSQQGDGNTVAVTQSGERQNLYQLQQAGNGNAATVSQSGSFNGISSISQSADGNAATVTQSGSQNLIGRSQYRALPRATQGETESGIYQSGGKNVLTISQTGTKNQVNVARQDSTGYLTGNTATLTIDGSYTGSADFSGGFAAGSGFGNYAYHTVGLEQGVVRQTGSNSLNYTITNNNNSYAFQQNGTGTIRGATAGTGNQIAIGQELNSTADLNVTGDSNNIGVYQKTNTAAVAAAKADITVVGNRNNLGVSQTQNGNATSSITVSLYGDGNNSSNLGGFTGDAGSVFFSRTPGLIEQAGDNNSINLTVGTAGSNSNDNLFAFRQSSGNNTIVGSIKGNNNQVVVSQSGGAMTHFTQVGSFNNIGVKQ